MLHIIQNDPEVPPGNLLDFIDIEYAICRADLGEPLPLQEKVTALIVLGGAMGANDDGKHPFLVPLKLLIRDVVTAGRPYLGICLGGQLLAAVLGAAVVSGRWEELGTLPVCLEEYGTTDPLFKGVPQRFITFQWHHDSFELPHGSLLLASSSACQHQAFRYGECAWGLQFHPEVTEQIIRDWCAWDSETRGKTETLVADFNTAGDDYIHTARLLLRNFINQLDT